MDSSTEWPWSLEEEAEWKAELEEKKDDDFLQELIDSAVEDGTSNWRYPLGMAPPEQPVEDDAPEKYSVTA